MRLKSSKRFVSENKQDNGEPHEPVASHYPGLSKCMFKASHQDGHWERAQLPCQPAKADAKIWRSLRGAKDPDRGMQDRGMGDCFLGD